MALRITNGSRGLLALGLAMACCAATAAPDAAAATTTRWGCQVQAQQLACFVDRSAATPMAAAAAAAPADPRLPPIVRELRQRPAWWRGRTVVIPLYTEPFDESRLQPLAQAVLCGAVAGCEAVIGLARWSSATAWLDFADANDPLLQRAE